MLFLTFQDTPSNERPQDPPPRRLLGRLSRACSSHGGCGNSDVELERRTNGLQIRVGTILKKVHTLKPGCSKRVKSKSIYKAYRPAGEGGRGLVYYYDEACQPYVWINDLRGDFARVVREQYLSLHDLRECSEIRILRDHLRGCICVRKKARTDFC